MSSYLLLNKPKGVITSTRSGTGRRTVVDFIPFSLRGEHRWYSVGLLDPDATGLVLLTDDVELARQLDHPKLGVLKEYRVLCAGLAGDEQLQKLRGGMYLVNPTADGTKTTQRAAMESVRILKRHVDRARGGRTLLGVTVRESEPREIRRKNGGGDSDALSHALTYQGRFALGRVGPALLAATPA